MLAGETVPNEIDNGLEDKLPVPRGTGKLPVLFGPTMPEGLTAGAETLACRLTRLEVEIAPDAALTGLPDTEDNVVAELAATGPAVASLGADTPDDSGMPGAVPIE